MKPMFRKKTAFSMIELLAVVTILGFIAALIVPRVGASSTLAKEKSCFHNRAEINVAIEMFYSVNGTFPTAITDIDTVDVFPEGIPTCPVTGVTYTINATTHRVQGHLTSHP